jgi:hypothetical protein
MSGPTFNQSHSGSGDNVVNYGQPRFDLTDEMMAKIASDLKPGKPVLVAYKNEGRSPSLGERLKKYLAGVGFPDGGTAKIGIGGFTAESPVTFYRDGIPGFGGGAQAVYIDASL